MSAPPEFHANGLRLELATRRMRGPLIAGSRPRRWTGWAVAAPSIVLIVVLVLVPAGWTVVSAVRGYPLAAVGSLLVLSGAVTLTRFVRRGRARWLWPVPLLAAAAGLFLLAGSMTADGRLAYLRTFGWVVFGVVLLGVALVLAWWSRGSRWLWRPLIVPFGISAFVSGVAFRLIFQYLGDRLGIAEVGTYRLWFAAMLGSAFLWTWLGFLTGLFRAGIRAIEADPVRTGYLYGGSRRGLLPRLFELLRPVVLIAGLVVGVAAARIFDVVLIGVPGALQYRADSATVHWWRLVTDTDRGADAAAAYALPLAVLVGFVAWLLQTGLRRHRSGWSGGGWPGAAAADRMAAGQRVGPLRALGISLVSGCALIPLGVLVLASLRRKEGTDFGAFAQMWRDEALVRSLQTSAWVAGLATVIVVTAAVPVAYRLAALRPERMFSRMAVITLVVLSVLPVQSYLGPLDTLIAGYGLSGTRIPLILVHAAAGLPIAVLILRGALLAPPDTPAADALYGLASPGTIARRVLGSAGPALGAVAVLEFVQVWNDFIVGLLLSGAGASPWSLLLWGEAREFAENADRLAAGSLIAAVLPVALLLATWRRWLVPGLTGGALR